MPHSCAAFKCHYRCTTQTKSLGITFHRFPKDDALRRRWEIALRREGFSASSSSMICSEHFKPEDFDKTGQTVRLRDGVIPSVFSFPAHLQRPVATRTTETSKKAEETLPVDCSKLVQDIDEPFPVPNVDHSYTLPSSPDDLRARLNDALARVESLEREKRNAKDRERRAKSNMCSLLEDLRGKNLINEELKDKLDSYSGKYYIATMTMITASTSLTIFIMNIHFCGAEAKPVPHWAKVLIMSKIFFVYEVGENCTTPESDRSPLYSEEPMSEKSIYHDDRFRDRLYDYDTDPYKYSNGHGVNHHNKHQKNQANGNVNRHHYNNHNNQTSRLEMGEVKREPTRHYHHIRRDELDYDAPPQPRNLQHLNGGMKEQLLYSPEKQQVQACPCCCPCLQHKQVLL